MRGSEKGDNLSVTVAKPGNPHLSDATDATSAPDPYAPLVLAAALGDESAMEQLLMRAQQVAFRFSLLVCGHAEDAEDVMQDALIRTYKHVDSIKDPSAFRTWLFRTVRNACLMKRRKRVDEPARVESLDQPHVDHADGRRVGTHDVATHSKGPDDLALNAWLGRELRTALAKLPPAYRMIVLLREMEGLSTREVAEVTRMTEDNVKTRLHRARVMLRESLEATR
ncbi:MAG: RNA polymerase sigma factor [Acidimicrobiia bacterium]|nr:RNA polymerase sigma factor [Acidimicrobiia bacterium]